MENKKAINGISIDMQNFYSINGSLDLNNRVLEFRIDFETFQNAFNLKIVDLFSQAETVNKYKIIYIRDKDGINYSCINCIFGFKIGQDLYFYTTPIDTILENILTNNQNIAATKLTFTTSFPKKFDLYISSFGFKYIKSKRICINKYVENNNVIVEYTIESSTQSTYTKLSNIMYLLLELTFLYLGDMPKIESILIFNEKEIRLYNQSAPKYVQRKNLTNLSTNGILSYLTSKTVSKNVLREFMKFRKTTKILFDILMINMNASGYIEVANLTLIQLLEGLYKTVNIGTTKELWEILEFYFIKNSITNTLLVKRDLTKVKVGNNNTTIFLKRAKGHRHYLSHLNMNDSHLTFQGHENIYAYWKLSLCVRIYIMQFISATINMVEFSKVQGSIEIWAKKHHFRYKK